MSVDEKMFWAIWIATGIVLFLPWIVALFRGHRNSTAIFTLDLALIGPLVIGLLAAPPISLIAAAIVFAGWAGSMIWAVLR